MQTYIMKTDESGSVISCEKLQDSRAHGRVIIKHGPIELDSCPILIDEIKKRITPLDAFHGLAGLCSRLAKVYPDFATPYVRDDGAEAAFYDFFCRAIDCSTSHMIKELTGDCRVSKPHTLRTPLDIGNTPIITVNLEV